MILREYILATLFLVFTTTAFSQAHTFTIATYNIKYDNPSDGKNAWDNRKENLKALIKYHEFDIFGTQEGLINQLKDITEMGEYAFTGGGRDDGKQAGEHSAIFYRSDRFNLLKAGDFWFSETPDKPSLGWDATCCNRICSWARFRDIKSGKIFYVFSAHFDHQGVEARRESARLLVKKIKAIADDTPVICLGDFNATPETAEIKTMSAFLGDAYNITVAPPYGPVGTFNGFRFDAELKNRIDYIFVSRKINVLKYAVLTDANQSLYPSDHLPVVARISIE